MSSPESRSSSKCTARTRLRRAGLFLIPIVLTASLLAVFGGESAASVKSAKHADVIGQPRGVMWDGASARAARPSALNPFLSPLSAFGPASALVSCPQPGPDPGCNMTYHNGPLVIGPHTAYIVYWEPPGSTVSANYHSLITRYLTDVAADSGRATNVYGTDTQYTDSTSAAIQYNITFGGALTDTTAYPATNSGCPTTDGTNTASNCLEQTQEATELDNFIQANSLPRGLNTIYFLVLPQTVETCSDDHTSCGNFLNIQPGRYCAYHSSFNIGGHGQTLWANEPYVNTGAGHCDSGNRSTPNGDIDAEAAINALSHEHNETMTDPTNGGWFDVDGTGENGDKCNFQYGPSIASTTNGAYNQLINHNPYETQLEWSNAITGCAANFGAVAPTAAFTFSPPSPKALDPVSFDGTGSQSNNTGGYIIGYAWTFGDGGTASGATPSHTYATAGTYTVQLTVKDDAGLTSSVSHDVTVVTRPTATTYTGDTSGDYHDSVTLSAHLADGATSGALSGKSISFTLGSQSCSGSTNGSGNASCSITLNQIPGGYTVKASFAGDSVYASSSDSKPFTIEKEETTLTYTGPKVILAGASAVTLTATLVEDGANDNDGDGGSAAPNPSGQTITFTLGSQSCSGTTDASGNASCQISPVSGSTLGQKSLTTSFAGDAYYLGSSDSDQVIVFAFPSRGAFTLGDATVTGATASTVVTWWGASWSSLNSLTGGGAPSAFKGFDGTVTTLPSKSPANVCGTTFTADPGNSGPPTSSVPSYMGVVVASQVTKSGNTINGKWAKIVVVKVNPGYDSNPGHAGTGTIVATFCP